MDIAQELEDLLEELGDIRKAVNKLKTASVSGMALRKRIKDVHKRWLPLSGVLEKGNLVDASHLTELSETWTRLVKFTDGFNAKSQYKKLLGSIISTTESSILHTYIKSSGLQTIGTPLRKLISAISEPELLKYLDESIRCAEANCVRASVVLAWCAVAFRIHEKLVSIGLPQL